MNRSKARLLTLIGIACCLISIVLPIYAAAVKMEISPFVVVFFVIGVVIIVFSLAYYTEK